MQARSLLFTIYGDFVLRYGGEVWVGSIIRAMAEFNLSAPAVRVAVSRVAQEGLVSARKVGNKSYYVLTDKGRRRIEDGVRRLYRQGPESWDGQWRIMTFTVPDDRRELRDHLRGELPWLGFGQLTANTWISPLRQEDAVKGLVEEYDLEGCVDLFTARYSGPQEDRALAARCWNLAEIGQRHEEFIAVAQPRLDAFLGAQARGEDFPDNRCFAERVWLVHEYRKFLHFDPGLPAELLPAGWPGARANQLFWEYYRHLSGGAERFFLSVFHATPPTAGRGRRDKGQKRGQDDTAPEPAPGRRRTSVLRRGW